MAKRRVLKQYERGIDYFFKSIGEFSFYNGLLTSLLIPKNLESIGRGSFWDQPNLTQFQVDSGNQFFSSVGTNYFSDFPMITLNGGLAPLAATNLSR
jgi:hypothetical protein